MKCPLMSNPSAESQFSALSLGHGLLLDYVYISELEILDKPCATASLEPTTSKSSLLSTRSSHHQ